MPAIEKEKKRGGPSEKPMPLSTSEAPSVE
jgi:hypothetical protein